MCLSMNAVPKSTTRLRSKRRASNEENWLFHSVHRKKNENSQCSKPRSGSTELKAWAEAKKSVSNNQMFETFSNGEWSAVTIDRSSSKPPRMSSNISRTASTSEISGGGKKTNPRSSELTRNPPKSVTLRKINGSTT